MRGLFALGLSLALAVALAPAAGARPAGLQAANAADFVFSSGAGALFFHVKPDRAQDFEAVVATLAGVLDRATDPTRREQATAWRIYKSLETPQDVVIYVFYFDPAVVGADYDPVKVLSEAMPAEVQALYDRLRADVVRVERMGLARIR